MNLAVVAGLGLIGSFIINNNKNDESNYDPITDESKHNINKYNQNLTSIDKKVNEIEQNEQLLNLSYSNGYKNPSQVKMFPNQINNQNHHIYDDQTIKKIKDNYYQMAKNQREKSQIPERTNIIPPFYNQPYENYLMTESNKLTMGPVPTSELTNYNTESFVSQFDLQTVDNIAEPASMGDAWQSTHRNNIINLERNLATSQGFSPFDVESNDMTYRIVPPEMLIHNNMQPNTSKRDIEMSESNNFEYKMDIFSGSSKNWHPKRESVPFFDPEEFTQMPTAMGSKLVSDQERDRIYVSKIKQDQRPFEPIQTAPGLNLEYDEQPKTGQHDTFRVMPKDTNDIRSQNKPKLTFEGRIAGAPKKGNKRGITAPVIKRRPEQLRYQTVNDLVPNKAVVNGPSSQGNYIIPNNARTYTTKELIGPAQGPTNVGPKNRNGKVKITKRVTHVENKLGPTGTKRYSTNAKSYNILENQRMTTNHDITGNLNNKSQGAIAFDDSDIAKTTGRQTLSTVEFNKMIGQLVGSYSNLSDNAKQTIKQIISTQSYQQIMSSAQHNVYSNLSDNARSTLKEILTLCELNTNMKSANGQTYANPTDVANTTLRQIHSALEFNTNTKPVNGQTYANSTDIMRTTGRQTLSTTEFNTMMSQLIGAYSNLSDKARTTIKQLTTNSKFNTNIGSSQHNIYSNLTDEARMTIKQLLTNAKFNTNIGNVQHNAYANLTDEAKHTLREILSVIENNTHMQSGQHNPYSALSDKARVTLKELLSTNEFNTNMGNGQHNSYANITDRIKTTIKELLAVVELNTNMQSGQHGTYANQTDDAKITGRQLLTETEFNTFIGKTMSTYANISDEAKQTIKQIIAVQPLETMIGITKMGSYANITDEVKTTLKQLLTLQTFSNYVKANPGSYANLSDSAKHTLKELLSSIEYNNNINAANKQSYADLSDVARNTIKQFIASQELNTNIGTVKSNLAIDYNDLARNTHKQDLILQNSNTHIGATPIRREIAVDYNNLARTTHKQDLLNQNYIGNITNSSIGTQQVDFLMPMTMKDLTKIINYNSIAGPASYAEKPTSQMAEHNMTQNITKEIIAQGQYPTLSGPKLIPISDNSGIVRQNNKPNYTRANAPGQTTKINLEDRKIFGVQLLKEKTSYDERLYNELLSQFDENPLINNPQTTTKAKFKY